MTMRSIEAQYEFEEEQLAEFENLLHLLDEASDGADLFALVGALAVMIVESVQQIDNMNDQEKLEFLQGAMTHAWQGYQAGDATFH